MTIHKTDRNIVNVSSLHNALDIAFGPSDDDFHYQRHHGTVAHEQTMIDKNEIDIKLIFQGGGCEIQWSSGERVRNEFASDGYLNVNSDGKITFPFNTDAGIPYYVEFDSDGLRIYNYEGEPPADQRDECLVFDSNTAPYTL